MIYHTKRKNVKKDDLIKCDIVISTFDVAAAEFIEELDPNNGELFKVTWFRIVLDEAHYVIYII